VTDRFSTEGKTMGMFERRPDPRKDTRPSSWLVSKRDESPGTKACKDCKGTGSSGFVNGKGETIACSSCGGFGY
jgi:hypothetical protein